MKKNPNSHRCNSHIVTISFSQDAVQEILPNPNDQSRVITTGVCLLCWSLLTLDHAGMGDIGVATSVDGFSQQWNRREIRLFRSLNLAVGLSYTPYLSETWSMTSP
jgi:hypothetical protein